jgi:S-disulfanyl-L-cysteine oxidoreductase SoxD
MSARLTLLGAGMALLALHTTTSLGQSRSGGTDAGRYTAEQAVAGAQLYAIHCAMCHGNRLEGRGEVPALTGRFVANWAGRPLADMFAYISQAMPQHAPGTLAAEQNAQLISYILEVNGAPAGRRPLPADEAALRRIIFDPPGVDRST